MRAKKKKPIVNQLSYDDQESNVMEQVDITVNVQIEYDDQIN